MPARVSKFIQRFRLFDTLLTTPPILAVAFCDESRLIASEYRGGLQRYTEAQITKIDHAVLNKQASDDNVVYQKARDLRLSDAQENNGIRIRQNTQVNLFEAQDSVSNDPNRRIATPTSTIRDSPTLERYVHPVNCTNHTNWVPDDDWPLSGAFYSDELPICAPLNSNNSRRASLVCHGPTSNRDWDLETEITPDEQILHGSNSNHHIKEFIATQDELNYMQAFADGVGVWMDSLNSGNHFTQVIPWYALKSPVLLNSLMACGAKHLSFSNPEFEDKAVALYNTATAQLVRILQNPDRNVVDCATGSILLNVYEAMSHKPIQKMSHMVGARALIRECGWNAKSTGIPAACFWLSIGMEVLYCLSMNWTVTWDPDCWGVDTDWAGDDKEDTDSQTWVHRSFYILAKVVNFRATALACLPSDPHRDQSRISSRLAEWQSLKQLCDNWNDNCPRSMRPVGYLAMSSTNETSAFPKIWFVEL